jgi:transcription initiation factor IIE alpha subunit
MTTALEWARRGYELRHRWLYTLEPNDTNQLGRVVRACEGQWLTSREVARYTGINGNSVRPLLYAATRKRLLLRQRLPEGATTPRRGFPARYLYRLMGT